VTRFSVVLIALASLSLAACRAGSPGSPALTLNPGNYTPLGGAQKSDQPTPSEWADLQAAEKGTLGQPALVEFYADY
jgi:hypothetical protein